MIADGGGPSRPPARLGGVRDYMDAHFAQPLSLAELARRAHMSRYHFVRQFRRRFHVTPRQYLIRKRVDRAKALLAHSALSVTEICFAVGFASVGSFSARFHRIVGWPPSVYRARLREQRRDPLKFIPGCFRARCNLSKPS